MTKPPLIDAAALAKTIEQSRLGRAGFLIGIDGCGGAGKSHLARRLRDLLSFHGTAVALIQMDDFYLPAGTRGGQATLGDVGEMFDWRRVRDQVLAPLRAGNFAQYQRYDWPSDTLAEWHSVSGGVAIIEGVYATRFELAHFYDMTIWVDCAREARLARGIERDSESARTKWEQEWMPAEDRYVSRQTPHTRATFLFAGDPPAEIT